MAKKDVVVRTAADLERKYNFASLLGLKKNVEITTQGIQKIENELSSMLNALVINLKDVLDSQSEISLWFYSGIPTKENSPYIDWENPDDHIGDIYYDQNTGYVYQWNGVWEVNTSPDLVEAMAITNSEIDTSKDHERKVFFDTPTIPYSNGDWWIKEDGTLFICQISKTSGTYEKDDFISSSSYTESIAEKIGEEIKVLKGTITMISENYAKFTDLATGGSTTISGDNITTGNIQSQNYIKDTSGTKIFLEDGTIDTKNFKLHEDGTVSIGGGSDIRLFDGDSTDAIFSIIGGENLFALFSSSHITLNKDNKYSIHLPDRITFEDGTNTSYLLASGLAFEDTEGNVNAISTGGIWLTDGTNETSIGASYVQSPIVIQTSLKEQKKNFEKFENALSILKDIDIYKYNLKFEEDGHKKHIGFVIGEDYKYSSEITAVDKEGKEIGVDNYSMTSLCLQAIKEQQEMIEELKKEIQMLKEG